MNLQINIDELLKIIGIQRVEIEMLNKRIAIYEQAEKAIKNKPQIVPTKAEE